MSDTAHTCTTCAEAATIESEGALIRTLVEAAAQVTGYEIEADEDRESRRLAITFLKGMWDKHTPSSVSVLPPWK